MSAQFTGTLGNLPTLTVSATTQGIWDAGTLGQDISIGLGANTLTITGNATLGLNSQANAGIILDDATNHNLSIIGGAGSLLSITNSTGFYVNNASNLTVSAATLALSNKQLTLGGTGSGNILINSQLTGTTGSIIVNDTGGGAVTLAGGSAVSAAGTTTLTNGTLIISGGSTQTGNTLLTAGILDINNNLALGTGTLSLSGTAGTIDNSSGSPITIANKLALAAGTNITYGGTGNLSQATGTIVLSGNSTITTNGTGTLSLGGVISGAGFSLSKAGPGTLDLSAANTFSGGISILSGTVISGVATSLGPAADGVTLGSTSGNTSATLLLNGAAAITDAHKIVLAANAGGGLLTIGSAGSFGATFTGGVTGTNNFIINDGTTSNALIFSTNPINNAGTVTNSSTSSGAVTISGGIGSNVTQIIENSTASALTISGALAVNASGTTLVNAAGTKIQTVSGGINGTGNLVLQNNSPLAAGITLSTASANNTGSITNSGIGTGGVTISAVIGTNVTGVFQQSATSALTLSGANTFTGGLDIINGVVIAGVSNAGTTSGAAGPSTVAITLGDPAGGSAALLANSFTVSNPINLAPGAAGTLNVGNNGTNTAASFSGAISLNGNNLSVVDSGTTGSTTLAGSISGSGNLNITNSATTTGGVNLAGNNAGFAGNVNILAGTTTVNGSANALGTGTVYLGAASGSSPATLSTATALTISNNIVVQQPSARIRAGGTKTISDTGAVAVSFSGASTGIVLNDNLTLANTSSNVLTIGDAVSGPGSLTIGGTGVVALTAANSYAGGTTTVAGGTLRASDGIGLTSSSLLTITAGVFETAGSFTRALGSSAGQVQLTGGASGFSANGGPGAVTLGGGTINWGSPNFAPTTLILNGSAANSTITLTNDVDLDNTGSSTNRAIAVNAAAGSATAATISGDLFNSSGSAGLTKSGAGTLVLTGSDTYTGATTISGGTLSFQGAAALPSVTSISLGAATLQISNDGTGSGTTINAGNNITSVVTAGAISVSAGSLGNSSDTVAFGALASGISTNDAITLSATNNYGVSFTSP